MSLPLDLSRQSPACVLHPKKAMLQVTEGYASSQEMQVRKPLYWNVPLILL